MVLRNPKGYTRSTAVVTVFNTRRAPKFPFGISLGWETRLSSRKNRNVRANWTGDRQCNISRHRQHRRIRRQRGRSPRWNERRESRDIPCAGNGNASHRTTGPSIKRERPLLRRDSKKSHWRRQLRLPWNSTRSLAVSPDRVIANFAFDKFHCARVFRCSDLILSRRLEIFAKYLIVE